MAVKAVFLQQTVGQLLETVWRAEKLTVEMSLPGDGADERRNASECQSNSVPRCVKGGELSVGLTKAQ
jgi:hypothetical protein